MLDTGLTGEAILLVGSPCSMLVLDATSEDTTARDLAKSRNCKHVILFPKDQFSTQKKISCFFA